MNDNNFFYNLERTIRRTLFNQVICIGAVIAGIFYDRAGVILITISVWIIGMILAYKRETEPTKDEVMSAINNFLKK